MLHTSDRACFIVIHIHLTTQLCSGGLHHNTVELNHTLVIWITTYVDWLGTLSKFVQNSTIPTCLEITGYQIKYSIVLWLLELEIRNGQKV